MKKLIFTFVMIFIFSLFAQEKTIPVPTVSDQNNEWMTNIASDSMLRAKMLQMIIDNSKDNPEEMLKIVNLLLADNDMRKMINEVSKPKTSENKLLEMHGKMNESKETMKMTQPDKKPIITK